MLLFDANAENVKAVVKAQESFAIPKCATLHNFILPMQERMLAIMFTWSDPDHERGKAYLQEFIEILPPIKMNTVSTKSPAQHNEQVPMRCLPWGGQRSIYIKEMSQGIIDILMAAFRVMPDTVNIGWSMEVAIDHKSCLPNCFGVGNHIMLSFADMVPEESLLKEARAWNDALYTRLRESGESAIMEGSYPPLTRPDDRSAEQLFGDKWQRVRDLKTKYDSGNVFGHGAPKITP